MGDVALPLFRWAKALKKAPAAIATNLAQELNQFPALAGTDQGAADDHSEHIAKIEAAGPYLNATFNNKTFAQQVLSEIIDRGEKYGCSDLGKNRNVVVDFSSPNIAKPFSIGHLRSTVIGNAIRNMYKALGYNSLGMNHLGDWGKQFGMLGVAFSRKLPQSENELQEAMTRGEGVLYLRDLYVEIHAAAEVDPSIHDQARDWFLRLEQGNPDEMALWQRFRDLSLDEFNRVYGLLGIQFDYVRGEAFYFQTGYVDRMVKELKAARQEKKGTAVGDNPTSAIEAKKEAEAPPLLQKSEDAWIVDLSDHNMPPCLILKADGATLYATRDIAAIVQRTEEFDPDRIIYVVGAPQSLHFNQVFLVLRQLGYGKAADHCVHVPFGLIKFKEGVMSTRKGNVILLEDVLNRSIEQVREIIKDRSGYTDDEREEIAQSVGIGAIVFADLSASRIKDWDFDWSLLLNFDGRTGPYLLYTHARLASILRKYGSTINTDVDWGLLDDADSARLVRALARYPEVLVDAADQYEPSILSRYLLDLAEAQNKFYNANRVLDESNPDTTKARILLIACARQVLDNGLRILGLKPVEKM